MTDEERTKLHHKQAVYRARNRERIRQQQAKWRAAHPERSRELRKNYRDKNRQQISDKQRIYAAERKDHRRAYGKAYYIAHKEQRRVQDRIRRESHKERIKAMREHREPIYAERRRQWCRNNRHIVATRRLKRRAAEQQALPAWADLNAIRAFYTEAERLTEATGIVHEVDHIYPIQGRNVCGLHCEANLQILTFTENRRKGNRLTPHITPPQFLSEEVTR